MVEKVVEKPWKAVGKTISRREVIAKQFYPPISTTFATPYTIVFPTLSAPRRPRINLFNTLWTNLHYIPLHHLTIKFLPAITDVDNSVDKTGSYVDNL